MRSRQTHCVIGNVFSRQSTRQYQGSAKEIEEITGVKRIETQVREFLKRLNLCFRKEEIIPAKADPEEQKEFLEQELQP